VIAALVIGVAFAVRILRGRRWAQTGRFG
jgi:hypothetical protein